MSDDNTTVAGAEPGFWADEAGQIFDQADEMVAQISLNVSPWAREPIARLIAQLLTAHAGAVEVLAHAPEARVPEAGAREPGPCILCVGECRGHSLGHDSEWVPEAGSVAAAMGPVDYGSSCDEFPIMGPAR